MNDLSCFSCLKRKKIPDVFCMTSNKITEKKSHPSKKKKRNFNLHKGKSIIFAMKKP